MAGCYNYSMTRNEKINGLKFLLVIIISYAVVGFIG